VSRFGAREGPQPCPAAVVQALPRREFAPDLGEAMFSQDCPICSEEYKTGDKLVFLPCTHAFHDACLQGWLDQVLSAHQHNTCPTCRQQIQLQPQPARQL